jgi:hypothetical protein
MPPISPNVIAAIGTGFSAGFMQRIENLTVWPRVQTVRAWFETTQPTVPIVAVLKPQTDQHQQRDTVLDLKFHFFNPPMTDHAYVLGEGDNRLAQGAKHVLSIAAPATEYLKRNPSVPLKYEHFTTLRRRATVRLQAIHVSLDGDSNSPGELVFAFAVYDGETRDVIGEPYVMGAASIPDGRTTAVDIRFPIEFAPDSLLLYAHAIDNDSYDFPLPGTGFDLPGSRPSDRLLEGAEEGWYSADTWEATWGSFAINLPLDHTESWTQSFRLVSPPGPVQFHVDFSVEAEVWNVAERTIPGSATTKKMKRSTSMAGAIGQLASAFGRRGHTHLVAVGPERGLMVKRIPPPNARSHDASWRLIDSLWSAPVSTVADCDGRIHVLTVDDSGAVRHRAWQEDADPSPEEEWASLGGAMIGPVLAHHTSGVVELFSRGRDGTIYHRRGLPDQSGNPRHEWMSLGECIGGSLDVVGTTRSGTHLFAHDESGRVAHKWHDGSVWRPSADAWLNLGDGGGEAVFAAAGDDGGVAVVSVADGGSVRWKEWSDGHWSPDEGRWESAETIDELLNEAPPEQTSARA